MSSGPRPWWKAVVTYPPTWAAGGLLVLLGVEHVDAKTATETANILLKYRSDIEKAIKEFAQSEETFAPVEG